MAVSHHQDTRFPGVGFRGGAPAWVAGAVAAAPFLWGAGPADSGAAALAPVGASVVAGLGAWGLVAAGELYLATRGEDLRAYLRDRAAPRAPLVREVAALAALLVTRALALGVQGMTAGAVLLAAAADRPLAVVATLVAAAVIGGWAGRVRGRSTALLLDFFLFDDVVIRRAPGCEPAGPSGAWARLRSSLLPPVTARRLEAIEVLGTAGDADASAPCQVCGDPLGAAALRACTRCASRYHGDCFEYVGGCARYGCGGTRAVPVEAVEAVCPDVPAVAGGPPRGGAGEGDDPGGPAEGRGQAGSADRAAFADAKRS